MDVSDANKSFFSGLHRASGNFNASLVVRVANAPPFQVPISASAIL